MYVQQLKKRPVQTKALTAAAITGFGSVLGDLLRGGGVDKLKAFSYALFGMLVTGPVVHHWLAILEAHGPKNILLRVLLDRTVFHFPFQYFFFIFTGILRGEKLKKLVSATNAIFPNVISKALRVWPPIMLANFYYVPLQFRPLVANVTALMWSSYLAVST